LQLKQAGIPVPPEEITIDLKMLSLAIFLTLLWSCQDPGDGTHPGQQAPSAVFEKGIQAGLLKEEELSEISGMVRSIVQPGHLWIHNDSGDLPLLYLIDDQGALKRRFYLKGASHLDWEDIAICPGPGENPAWLLIGDIGDNLSVREYISIFRLQEPGPDAPDTLTAFSEYRFSYPDGARDAETLFCDPSDGKVYLLTKREARNRLYEVPFADHNPASVTELIFLRELPVSFSTAGDIGPDGSEILIRNYTRIYYWYRPPGTGFVRAFDSNPRILPYDTEPQGESIAWKYDRSGYYTLSERIASNPVYLLFYQRK
jgi:hypothetical protein